MSLDIDHNQRQIVVKRFVWPKARPVANSGQQRIGKPLGREFAVLGQEPVQGTIAELLAASVGRLEDAVGIE